MPEKRKTINRCAIRIQRELPGRSTSGLEVAETAMVSGTVGHGRNRGDKAAAKDDERLEEHCEGVIMRVSRID